MGKWRIGRRLGRTLYRQSDAVPGDDDVLLGMMDDSATALLAAESVNAVARLRMVHIRDGEQDDCLGCKRAGGIYAKWPCPVVRVLDEEHFQMTGGPCNRGPYTEEEDA